MKVAVAVIFDDKNRVLITRRSMHTTHGGMWEFPGGKLEEEELPATALMREVKEEVGIDILESRFLGEVEYQYDSKTVNLLIYSVDNYRGEARCCESQLDLRWVSVNNLADYNFPAANRQIIELIKTVQIDGVEHGNRMRM